MSYRTYRRVRYRYCCRTELTEVSGTGTDVVPNLSKGVVPVLMLYQTYRSVRYRYLMLYRTYQSVRDWYESLYRYRWYRYPCRTEAAEVSGTGMDVVSKLQKCPVPVLMSYRSYRSVRYREYRWYIPVVCLGTYRTVPNTPL